MKLQFSELIENYPISVENIARNLHKTKQWIYFLIKPKHAAGSSIRSQQLNRKHFLEMQNYIQEIGFKMRTIELTPANFGKFIAKTPVSTSRLSNKMGEHQAWIDKLCDQKPHERDPAAIARVQTEINLIGSILCDLVLVDFIQHDEIAHYLLKTKGITTMKMV